MSARTPNTSRVVFTLSPVSPLFRLRAALRSLTRQHPPGILGWQGAYIVKLLQFICRQRQLGGFEIVVELLHRFGADDHGRDEGLGQDIGERHARDGCAAMGMA